MERIMQHAAGVYRVKQPVWANRRFERKHSGLHRGVTLATLASLAIWCGLFFGIHLF
jgi:hypothetical protein